MLVILFAAIDCSTTAESGRVGGVFAWPLTQGEEMMTKLRTVCWRCGNLLELSQGRNIL